jgi:hypothetical protein
MMEIVGGVVVLLIAVLFVGLGIYLVTLGLRLRAEAAEPETWHTTEGFRPKASLEEHVPRKWGQSSSYSVKVRYSFSVNGKPYRSSCIAIGYEASTNKEAEEELLEKLKSATRLTVRYDPADPSRSCLTIGMHRQGTTYILFGFLVLWMFFGFAIMMGLSTLSDAALLESLDVQ